MDQKRSFQNYVDPWKVVHAHKDHNCVKCRKEKTLRVFVIYGSKYNPK